MYFRSISHACMRVNSIYGVLAPAASTCSHDIVEYIARLGLGLGLGLVILVLMGAVNLAAAVASQSLLHMA